MVSPGPIAPLDISIEPDLSNAAPFLAAAALTGGHGHESRLAGGDRTSPVTRSARHPAAVRRRGRACADGVLTVQGTDELHGVDLDLHDASELTPVVAALAALADAHQPPPRRRPHPRPRDRPARRAGGRAEPARRARSSQTHDGLVIHPRLLGGDLWHTYADHRMAQAGAVLGLVIPDVVLDDIGCTSKTMPEFVSSGTTMIDDSVPTGRGERPR